MFSVIQWLLSIYQVPGRVLGPVHSVRQERLDVALSTLGPLERQTRNRAIIERSGSNYTGRHGGEVPSAVMPILGGSVFAWVLPQAAPVTGFGCK